MCNLTIFPQCRKKAPFCSPINRAGRQSRMAAGGGFAGKARPRGGVETPPYGMRKQGCKPCPFVARPIPRLSPKIPLLWSGGAGCTIYRVPKRAGKNLSKKSKKGVDKGESGWYYSQAVRRGSAGRQAVKPHRYSLERVSGAKSSRKKFKKSQKSS